MSLKKVFIYDDEADPADENYENVLAVKTAVEETLGDGFEVALEYNAKRMKQTLESLRERPALFIFDVVNDRPKTQIAPPSKYCGVELGRIATERWSDVHIIYLTRLDSHDPMRTEAGHRYTSFRQWIEKNGDNTLTDLRNALRGLFPPINKITVGRFRWENARLWWDEIALEDTHVLKPNLHAFLYALLHLSKEKRVQDGPTPAVTYKELHKELKTQQDGALHTRKHELCDRIADIEDKVHKKIISQEQIIENVRRVDDGSKGGYRIKAMP
jgi:hypothetical protein